MFLKYNLAAISWGIFIVVITILPGRVLPRIPVFLDLFQPDKLIHVAVFAVYVILQVRGFRRQDTFPLLRRHPVPVTLLVALVLAGGTEVIQACCIPMRTGSIYDFTANLVGCLLGLWLGKGKMNHSRHIGHMGL